MLPIIEDLMLFAKYNTNQTRDRMDFKINEDDEVIYPQWGYYVGDIVNTIHGQTIVTETGPRSYIKTELGLMFKREIIDTQDQQTKD